MRAHPKLPNFLHQYSGLPGSIYVLFGARIINAAGNFVNPFLTFLLSDKLGMRPDQVGFFMMLSLLAQVPGVIGGGKLADHWGRKAVLVGSQLGAALLLLVCAFVTEITLIPWLLIASSMFNGAAQPASSALVADHTNLANRREAFSLIYLGINIGSAIGPMVAGLLFAKYMQWVFIGDALTTLIAVGWVQLRVKEGLPQSGSAASTSVAATAEQAESGSFWQVMSRRPVLTAMVAMLAVYGFVYHQHSFTLPLDLNQHFGSAGPGIFGCLMSVNALVVLFGTTLITWLTRRLPSLIVIALAGLFYALGFGSYCLWKTIPWYVMATALWTVGEVLSATTVGVYISCHAPISHRARFHALQTFAYGVGNCLSPVLMGAFIASYGTDVAWQFTMVLALTAMGLMLAIGWFESKQCQDALG